MLKQTLISSIAALAAIGIVHAQDSALLDIMVKKKLLTPKEAESVRADLVKEQAAEAPANKISVGSWVKEMQIGGDIRLRYQYDTTDFQVPPTTGGGTPSGAQRSRVRFRLRIHDDFKLNDNWFGGVELATSPASDSSNQTLGSGFGKYGIYISKAFLGWQASGDWLTLEGGKVPNPFYTTDLVWDPDINPDGFVQTVRFDKMFMPSEGGGGYSKDGKTFVAAAPAERPWQLALNLGEFIFNDNIENGNPTGLSEPGLTDSDISDDAWLFDAQLVGSYKFDHSVKVTFGPGFMFYNSGSLNSLPAGTNSVQFSGVPTITVNGVTSYVGETRDLAIVTAPGDISFKLGALPVKFYWDFAYNTNGAKRYEDIYGLLRSAGSLGTVGHYPNGSGGPFTSSHSAQDDVAYLLGLQVGENKKRGDLSANVNWRATGISAVDPNLNDSDFANGYLNTRGIKAGLVYNLTDFATFGVTYYYAWNLRDDLVGGAATSVAGASANAFAGPNAGGGLGNANVVQVLQVDLNVKF